MILGAILVLTTSLAYSDTDLPPGDRDGRVHSMDDGTFLAWDAESEEWLSPDGFWENFANRKRGKIWPSSDTFPPFRDVNEHDTFLYLTEHGACLMYFFHRRWRRANDVWRWGRAFNEYGGCARVFD